MLFNKNSIPESLTQSYHDFIKPEKIVGVRIMCILGIVLYLSFLVVDFFAIPSQVQITMIIRGIVILGFLISFALTYSEVFIKYYNFIQPTPYIFAATGITVMISISHSSDKANDIYFAGLILVLMALFSWSHSKIRLLSIISIFIISSYLFVLTDKYDNNPTLYLPELLTNLFFLISATIIGTITLLMRDQNLRQTFLLTRQLHESLLKKTVEANDNAYLANHDMLTGLPNRRFVMEQLEVALAEAKEKDKILVIMFLDLNGFKLINDTYGHKAGDEILAVVAKRLETTVSRGDNLSRLGGDEFLIGLLLEPEQVNEIDSMKQKYVDIISQPIDVAGNMLKVGTSIGIACYPMHGEEVGPLIDIADNKMYQHKENRTEINMNTEISDLEIDIIENAFELDIIDLSDKEKKVNA